MIIDFAVRPPYKGFLSLVPSFEWEHLPPPKFPRAASPWKDDCEQSPSKVHGSMEMFIAEMDEAGIAQAVVNHEGGRSNPELSHTFAVPNDEIAELGELYPERFHLLAGINLDDVKSGVSEVERVVGNLGFQGISVAAGWHDPPLYMDDEQFYPIYEKCQELGGILQLTISIFMGPDLSYIDPIRLQHIASTFPNLPIVVSHGGWPNVMQIIGIAVRYSNIWLAPDFYTFKEGVPGGELYVEAANYCLEDRLLFSSVYPSRPLKKSVEQFSRLPFREDVLEKALYNNAQWLLEERNKSG